MEVEGCWRCGGVPRVQGPFDNGLGPQWRAECPKCHSIGLPQFTAELAAKVWNDGQRKYRRSLSDTTLLEKSQNVSPPAAAETLPSATPPTHDLDPE